MTQTTTPSTENSTDEDIFKAVVAATDSRKPLPRPTEAAKWLAIAEYASDAMNVPSAAVEGRALELFGAACEASYSEALSAELLKTFDLVIEKAIAPKGETRGYRAVALDAIQKFITVQNPSEALVSRIAKSLGKFDIDIDENAPVAHELLLLSDWLLYAAQNDDDKLIAYGLLVKLSEVKTIHDKKSIERHAIGSLANNLRNVVDLIERSTPSELTFSDYVDFFGVKAHSEEPFVRAATARALGTIAQSWKPRNDVRGYPDHEEWLNKLQALSSDPEQVVRSAVIEEMMLLATKDGNVHYQRADVLEKTVGMLLSELPNSHGDALLVRTQQLRRITGNRYANWMRREVITALGASVVKGQDDDTSAIVSAISAIGFAATKDPLEGDIAALAMETLSEQLEDPSVPVRTTIYSALNVWLTDDPTHHAAEYVPVSSWRYALVDTQSPDIPFSNAASDFAANFVFVDQLGRAFGAANSKESRRELIDAATSAQWRFANKRDAAMTRFAQEISNLSLHEIVGLATDRPEILQSAGYEPSSKTVSVLKDAMRLRRSLQASSAGLDEPGIER